MELFWNSLGILIMVIVVAGVILAILSYRGGIREAEEQKEYAQFYSDDRTILDAGGTQRFDRVDENMSGADWGIKISRFDEDKGEYGTGACREISYSFFDKANENYTQEIYYTIGAGNAVFQVPCRHAKVGYIKYDRAKCKLIFASTITAERGVYRQCRFEDGEFKHAQPVDCAVIEENLMLYFDDMRILFYKPKKND